MQRNAMKKKVKKISKKKGLKGVPPPETAQKNDFLKKCKKKTWSNGGKKKHFLKKNQRLTCSETLPERKNFSEGILHILFIHEIRLQKIRQLQICNLGCLTFLSLFSTFFSFCSLSLLISLSFTSHLCFSSGSVLFCSKA